jgi:predicted nucleotidyltransferase component of viral defense system
VITEGHLVRHFQGRTGGRGPAIIDIAQDHLLYHLAHEGIFELGVALKGGTAVRKFRAGNAGRFSTDLDFAGVGDAVAELLLEVVDGAKVGPFGFGVEPIDGTRRARLLITSPFGDSDIPARLDLGRKALWLPAERLELLPFPIHSRYDLTVPAIPTARIEEVIAEKLARYRRVSLARDLYDLAWFAQRPFDEDLVRELTVLKVWGDVVDDRLGAGPFAPEDVLRPRVEADFRPEAIGYLTTPVEIAAWIERVRDRFGFLRALDEEQRLIARCSVGERWTVSQRIGRLASHDRPESG